MINILIGFGLGVVVFSIVVAILVFQSMRGKMGTMESRLGTLQSQVGTLYGQVTDLTAQVENRRHTENTIAGAEDSLSLVGRVLLEESIQSEKRQRYLEQVSNILAVMREGPRAYPVDRPNNRVQYRGRHE